MEAASDMRLPGVPLLTAAAKGFGSAPCLALYFSSSWCPECKDFTPLLKSTYESVNTAGQPNRLDVVYVSSDGSAQEMQDCMDRSHAAWAAVPFDGDHRTALKQRYSICAMREMSAVGVSKRVDGIPSLVVLNPSCDVITLKGVADIRLKGAAAIDEWTAKAGQSATETGGSQEGFDGPVCRKGGPC